MANIKYKENGEYKDIVVKVGDTLPIGAIIGFDTTQTIPNGWEYYAENQIKKIAPETPANGNIENTYGTSQENTYSQEYINGKLDIEQISLDDFITLNSGFTARTDHSLIWKQGKHIWGTLVINKTTGNFAGTNDRVGTIAQGYRQIYNSYCSLSTSAFVSNALGYFYINPNEGFVTVADSNNTGTYNWMKVQFDYVLP